ncbi:MAG TPA: hypothetical protein VGC76_15185 [Pyrinomonadaceae bacterium]
MFIKKFVLFLTGLLVFASCQAALGQTKKADAKKTVVKTDDSQFYQASMLEADYKQVDVVAYVNIKNRRLVGIGGADCKNDKGSGYCLYLLKADLKEVFKGNVTQREIEFYTNPDADYPKEKLMGERVVFLNKSDNYPLKTVSLGTMENSTRWIKRDVLKKMRKIAKKKS